MRSQICCLSYKVWLTINNGIFTQLSSLSIISLENIFNTLVDSFVENKIGIAENFLSETLALHLKENLIALYSKQLLRLLAQEMMQALDRIISLELISFIGLTENITMFMKIVFLISWIALLVF